MDLPTSLGGLQHFASSATNVKLDDNGEEFDTTIVAGLVGSQICVGTNSTRNTVRPLSAWWYVIMKEAKH